MDDDYLAAMEGYLDYALKSTEGKQRVLKMFGIAGLVAYEAGYNDAKTHRKEKECDHEYTVL